jgi:hypothetical protein
MVKYLYSRKYGYTFKPVYTIGTLNTCTVYRLLALITDISDPTEREIFWIKKLSTYVPFGLNLKEKNQFVYENV